MDTTTSQFSDFTNQFDSWQSSDLCEVPQSQDTVMSSDNDLFQVISQSSAELVRVPSQCLAAGQSSQESSQTPNTQSDADYIPGMHIGGGGMLVTTRDLTDEKADLPF